MKYCLPVVLLLLISGVAHAGAVLTYADLVRRLTDTEYLAKLPDIGEKCGLFSSYDRNSRYDETKGKYVKWHANNDGGGIIRKEGNVSVLAEMTGPGCIWRIWSATVGKGHMKIYLDGAPAPAVDLAFEDYFSHKISPFNFPALVYRTQAFGYNSYIPVPYQKSCKIVVEDKWGEYYQFTYSSFPAATIVPFFNMNLKPEDLAALAAADEKWGKGLGTDPSGPRAQAGETVVPVVLGAGQSATVAKLTGMQAITCLRVKLDPAMLKMSAAELEIMLRSVTLSIRWDGEKEPSVWSPLGDFFGTAPGLNKFKSLLSGMTDSEFYSYWYMPFASEAAVEMKNDGTTSVKLDLILTHSPLTQPVEAFGRFHAKWHRDAMLSENPDLRFDWTLLKTKGRGRFCGVMLNIWNPCGAWWGEGDEKFFVDGEKFPSTFGTGSEDYFGYAWCGDNLFNQAVHNQTRNDGRNTGEITVGRWHIPDSVPFQTGFDAYIEKYFGNNRPTQYACVAYWYQAPGGTDEYKALPVKERVGYQAKPYLVAGAIEGEYLKVLHKPKVKSGWNINVNDLAWTEQPFSNSTYLAWSMGEAGDHLVLAVPVQASGRYDIMAQFVKGKPMGIFQFYWNGTKLGEPYDGYSGEWMPSGEIKFGTLDLPAGENKLDIEITGSNKSSSGRVVGLDYLRLVPVKR